MKNNPFIALLLVVPALFSFTSLNFVAVESQIDFKIKNAGFWVDGFFNDFKVNGAFDENKLDQSYFDVEIEVESINTGIEARDKHLRRDDYFDVEKFPKITFKSTKIERKGNSYVTTGQLTVRSVTKTVSIPFKVSEVGNNLQFKGELKLNRLDYGVGSKSWVLGNKVVVDISCIMKAGV